MFTATVVEAFGMAMTSTERSRARRARARDAGLCVVCGNISPADGKTVCDDCNDSAKARVLGNRAKAKPTRKKSAAKKKTTAKRQKSKK